MAKKKLEIEVGVDQSQLDQVLQKTGELKKLSDNISIQYDIDGKPIDVVLNKSLNLQKQVRVLTAELRKTKEGTAEFKLLSTALGDAQDGLARTNAKSRDLLSSLQLIPGPVGEFASQLNGVIGLLKTFSSFSLKDIQFQFKETANDFKDIYDGFFGTKKVVDDTKISIEQNSDTLQSSTIAASAAANSQKNLAKEVQLATLQIDQNGNSVIKATKPLRDMTVAEVELFLAQRKQIRERVKSGETLDSVAASTRQAAIASGQLAAAEGEAAVATTLLGGALNFLKGALVSLAAATGIGLILVAIGLFVSLISDGVKGLYEWGTGAKEAARDTELFNKELETLNELLDLDLADAKRRNAVRVAELKAQGKSEVEIKKETVDGLRDQLKLVEQAQKDADKLENDLFKRSKKRGADIGEDLAKTQKRRTELDQQAKDLRTQIRVSELEETADGLKKKTDLEKKNAEDTYNRRLKELDALIQLEINKDATSKEVLQKYLEERAKLVIHHDKMTYAEAQLLREQNDKKTKDALEEDLKRVEAYLSKKRDLEIAAIEDEEQRQVAARFKKLKDDETALKYDYEFQKKTKAEQDEILKNMEIAYQLDLIKIRDSFYMKRFQKDEEAFLKTVENKTKEREATSALNKDIIETEIADGDMRLSNLDTFWDNFNTTYGDYLFGNKGLKQVWEKYFVDLREVYNQDYLDKQARFEKEKEDLKGALSANLITRESYDQQIISIDDKMLQNREQNAQKQLELDRLELDSKRANADMSIQIGERLTSALGAIAGKNRAIQKAAAIAEGITAIARIITDTTRAIASFSASVAPLGPAGIPIAAAYAVKAKISAALGIATIVGQSIGKLNSIDESGNTTATAGPQGNNLGRSYAQGGYIDGPRHAQGGVMINAEGGEAVMTRGAVTMFAPLLSAMNQMGGGTSFANMNVSRPDAPAVSNPASEQSPIIVKTYVVEKEMTESQNKQARLKDLSTL